MNTLRWDAGFVQRALLRAVLRRDALVLRTQQAVSWISFELNLATILLIRPNDVQVAALCELCGGTGVRRGALEIPDSNQKPVSTKPVI